MREFIYMAQDQGMTDPSKYVWVTFCKIIGEVTLDMLFYPWEKVTNNKTDIETRKKAFRAVKQVIWCSKITGDFSLVIRSSKKQIK